MRELMLRKLLVEIFVEIFGAKIKMRFVVRRRGNLQVWHLSWR